MNGFGRKGRGGRKGSFGDSRNFEVRGWSELEVEREAKFGKKEGRGF